MHVHTHTEAFNLTQNKMRAGGWIIIHRICNRRTEELVELRYFGFQSASRVSSRKT